MKRTKSLRKHKPTTTNCNIYLMVIICLSYSQTFRLLTTLDSFLLEKNHSWGDIAFPLPKLKSSSVGNDKRRDEKIHLWPGITTTTSSVHFINRTEMKRKIMWISSFMFVLIHSLSRFIVLLLLVHLNLRCMNIFTAVSLWQPSPNYNVALLGHFPFP